MSQSHGLFLKGPPGAEGDTAGKVRTWGGKADVLKGEY